MNNLEVIKYCQQSKSTTIPQLQIKFGLTYKKAKAIVEELIENGNLAYDTGIRYNYIGNFGEVHEVEFDDLKDEKRRIEERRLYLEARRKEIERRRNNLFNNDDDDEDEIAKEIDELRYKSLKLCIEKGRASATLIQRSFPIGFIKACELIDWMEAQGYVSASVGVGPREVLITMDEFNKIFNDEE